MTDRELEFMQDLENLLKKHRVEICATEINCSGDNNLSINIFGDSIDIDLYGTLAYKDINNIINDNSEEKAIYSKFNWYKEPPCEEFIKKVEELAEFCEKSKGFRIS